MKVGCPERRKADMVVSIGRLARGAVGPGLLVGLTALISGCGGSAVAPVQSPTEPVAQRRDRVHVVGKGDTLYSISWRFGIDYRTLARANSIRDPYTIHPGQRLVVPRSDDAVPQEPVVVAREPSKSDEPSARATGTDDRPAATPLPAPEPVATTPAARSVPAAPREEPPPVEESASKPAVPPPSAARTVAGLRWSRPTSGRTIAAFGRGGNNGIDIGGTFEQPIRAAAPGKVVYAGSGLVGYGKLVIVKHDSRLLSAYAHNERLHVAEGDDVRGGQHIADMGRSGKGHVMLHFEIRHDGKPVDPLRYLP